MSEAELLIIANQFLSPVNKIGVKADKITDGLINSTFKIQDSSGENYILQKINNKVFERPEDISSNIGLVASFLKRCGYPRKLIELHRTADNATIIDHDKWGSWRMMNFFKQTSCIHSVERASQASEAAKALGEFHSYLFDFEAGKLKETIPNFLNFTFRIEQFECSLSSGDSERIHSCEEQIAAIKSHYGLLDSYFKLCEELPKRVLHGDPKISNFLFSNVSDNVIALIDWDTIMAGTLLYDFGDMVRSFTNAGKEDAMILKGNFDHNLYKAIQDGYLFHLKDKLTDLEKDNLMLGAKTVTLIQAMRFLADYLNGDTYYQISDKEQNKRRAMNQIHLLKNLTDA